MESPPPAEVRAALAPLDAREQKIVAGMLTVMIQHPSRVRDKEWISEQLTHLALLAGEFEVDSAQAGVQAVQDYLQARANELVRASFLLFQRVGLDLAPRAAEGFTFEEAVARGLEYFSAAGTTARPPVERPAVERDLGEQPLARLMAERGLSPKDLVAASNEQLTHKMVSRAMKGRRLTANTMAKVERAWKRAVEAPAGRSWEQRDLFDYLP